MKTTTGTSTFAIVTSWLNASCFVTPFNPKPAVSTRKRWCKLPRGTAVEATSDPLDDVSTPLDELSEERKSNLFQFLLRDLQVEGVPLLGVDANQVHTMQAALWTTMAELAEQEEEQKACMIFEDIPVSALRSFVDDFMVWKNDDRLVTYLPELKRFHLSLVGKGVGPGIVVDAGAKPASSTPNQDKQQELPVDEYKYSAAMKMFLDRLGTMDMLPSEATRAIQYRCSAFSDICHVASTFWNCICELQATAPTELGSIILLLPAVGSAASGGSSIRNNHSTSYGCFVAIAEILSRSFCLYRGDGIFRLVHLHPEYDRDKIDPQDEASVHGHIPPTSSLRSMLRHNGNTEEADRLSDDDMKLLNFVRRAPVTAVWIQRRTTTADDDFVVDELNLDNSSVIATAEDAAVCSKNVLRLAAEGREALEAASDAETAVVE